MRQTTLTLQELLDGLSNPDAEYSACLLCLLANEIGELATKDNEAYRNLHTVLLSHANPEVQYAGICHLAKIGKCDEEVLLAIGKVSMDMSIPRPIRRTAILALIYLSASLDNGSPLPWEQFEQYREDILEGKR